MATSASVGGRFGVLWSEGESESVAEGCKVGLDFCIEGEGFEARKNRMPMRMARLTSM